MILSLLMIPALHVALIGGLCGLVGAFAYLDRRIFFAESVTHGTFPGAVLGVVIAAALGLGHSGMSAALYVGAFLGTIPLVALMRRLASIPGISSQGAAGETVMTDPVRNELTARGRGLNQVARK